MYKINKFMRKGTLSSSVLRCCILAPYVPLRATCSESVPCDELFILYYTV